jgi:hypothetical protein
MFRPNQEKTQKVEAVAMDEFSRDCLWCYEKWSSFRRRRCRLRVARFRMWVRLLEWHIALANVKET